MHLGRFRDASVLAKAAGRPEALAEWLASLADRPLGVKLAETTVIPFSRDNFIEDLMPAVPIEIDGKPFLGHIDTGGDFVAMSPRMAAGMGIPVREIGTGFANDRETTVSMGIIGSMRLGDAVLANVPVAVLPALTGVAQGQKIEDMIILGTGILRQFLSTWDNREDRLILSPRSEPASREAHLRMLPPGGREMEFFLHGDHYLLANGSLGGRSVVFFVDTGLVAIDPRGRQASLGMTAGALAAWGIDEKQATDGFVDFEDPITLGPVSRAGGAIKVMGPKHDRVWNDMPVEALLSFGFMKHFIWTLDFDRRLWILTPFEEEAAPAPRLLLEDELGLYAGEYEVAPGIRLKVTGDDGVLFLQAPGQQRVPMAAEPDGSFSIKAAGARVEFLRDDAGGVTGLVLHQGGNATRAARVE